MSKHDVAEIRPQAIGQSIPRKEDSTILTGRGEYIADIRLPNLLHAVFVRAPFAHATITNVDVSAARALPGVELVWSGADVARLTAGIPATVQVENFALTTQPVIARDEVRYVGEAVAVIVATSRSSISITTSWRSSRMSTPRKPRRTLRTPRSRTM